MKKLLLAPFVAVGLLFLACGLDVDPSLPKDPINGLCVPGRTYACHCPDSGLRRPGKRTCGPSLTVSSCDCTDGGDEDPP